MEKNALEIVSSILITFIGGDFGFYRFAGRSAARRHPTRSRGARVFQTHPGLLGLDDFHAVVGRSGEINGVVAVVIRFRRRHLQDILFMNYWHQQLVIEDLPHDAVEHRR